MPELGDSLLFSSLSDTEVEAAPNLKSHKEPSILKASAKTGPVGVCSVEVPPNLNDAEDEDPEAVDEPPNLKPPEGAVESGKALTNLKDPVDGDAESVPPNFNSPAVELEELEVPNLKAVELELVLDDCVPKPETKKDVGGNSNQVILLH